MIISHKTEARATEVLFTDTSLHIIFTDGREIFVPLEWFPRLRDAKRSDLERWRLIGDGIGISWEDLNEDISVPALLKNI